MAGRLEDGANGVVRGIAGKAEAGECALPVDFDQQLNGPLRTFLAYDSFPHSLFWLLRLFWPARKDVRCCP